MRPVVLLLWMVPGVLHAQSASITANIAFEEPSPSCTLSGAEDLSFGTLDYPGTGTVSVTVNAETGRLTTVPRNWPVTGHQVGKFQISGSHVSFYTVGMTPRTLPTKLTASRGSDTIDFSAVTRRSVNGTTWTATNPRAPGLFDSGTAGGLFSSFTRYYRLGGTISGIMLRPSSTTYSATVTLSLSCG